MIPELLGAAMAVLVAALPPPPEVVVLETKTYGTITIPHKVHLAERVACRSCHGVGRVGKIEFTPKSAHATCRNCHVEIKRGPVDCRGCHVSKKDAPDAPAIAQGEAVSSATPDAKAVETRSFSVAAESTHIDGRSATPGADPAPVGGEVRPRASFGTTGELGLVLVRGERQQFVVGPSLQLSARNGPTVITYGLAYAGSQRDGRTRFLVGGGRDWEVVPGVRATTVAVGGIDATHSPVSFLPALGVRGALELFNDSRWSLGGSITALADLARSGGSGERTGGVTVSLGISTGYRFGR